MINVFVDHTKPNIGLSAFVPKRDLHYLSMSPEEGFKIRFDRYCNKTKEARRAEQPTIIVGNNKI